MKRLYYFLMKTMVCIILFLIVAIVCKRDNTYQYFIQKNVYQESLSFASFKELYNQYLGGIFPIENVSGKNNQVSSVFEEKIVYQEIDNYLDGAVLKVGQNYLIPSMEAGIVVYIGEKEGYQNVIMVQDDKGVDVWYGNVCNPLVKLYDQVERGNYLGESCSEEMYLVYTMGNQILDYKNYLN